MRTKLGKGNAFLKDPSGALVSHFDFEPPGSEVAERGGVTCLQAALGKN